MTQNQIAYQKLLEEGRANLAREAENIRSNKANEAILTKQYDEAVRSHLASEAETHRANVAREKEENRSNLAKELEQNRSNVARENENHRTNVANETLRSVEADIKQQSANTAAVQAGTDYTNALTRKQELAVKQQTADTQEQARKDQKVKGLLDYSVNAGNQAVNARRQRASEIQWGLEAPFRAINALSDTFSKFTRGTESLSRVPGNLVHTINGFSLLGGKR